jgi:altronate hydrolase
VAIAKHQLAPGTVLRHSEATDVRVAQAIPSGHKVALRAVPAGQPVRRYGQIIGFASRAIEPGEHVHSHNLAVADFGRDYAFCDEWEPVELVPEPQRRSFLGYRRSDGRIGTRNYVAVLASVNCSSSATVAVVDHIERSGALADYPNVDGVIGFPHKGGCGAHIGSEALRQLQRTLAGIVHHPNVAGYVILSLGCEVNQPTDMIAATELREDAPLVITIQEDGGFAETVERGIEAVRRLLPLANQARRERVPASELMVALQCGGSDGWSGVTANPGLGKACDLLVRQGGTVVLGETPEIYGAEHLLTRRARSPEVGGRLVDAIRWWERYTAAWGASIDNNPAPGNKAGGHDDLREVARRGRQGGLDAAQPSGRLRRAGDGARVRPHGHAGVRSRLRHRTGRRRLHRRRVHDRTGLRVRVQAGAVDQDRDQQRAVRAAAAGHGHRRRQGPRRGRPRRAR